MDLTILAQYGFVGLLIIIAWLFKDHPAHGWATKIALRLGILAAAVLAGMQILDAMRPTDYTVRLSPPESSWSGFYENGAPVEKIEAFAMLGPDRVEGIAPDVRLGQSLDELKQRSFRPVFDKKRLQLWLNGVQHGQVLKSELHELDWHQGGLSMPQSRIVTDYLRKGEKTSLDRTVFLEEGGITRIPTGVSIQLRDWNYSADEKQAGAFVRIHWKNRTYPCDLTRSHWQHFEDPGEVNLYFQVLWLRQAVPGDEKAALIVLEYPTHASSTSEFC